MLNNKSFDILLIYNFRQIFDDNRVVAGTVDDLITNLVVFAYAVDEILREEEIQQQKARNEVSLDHDALVVVYLVGKGEFIEGVVFAEFVYHAAVSFKIGNDGVNGED